MRAQGVQRVLILHATAGLGHYKAALALEQVLKDEHPDWQVKCFDALDGFPAWIKKLYVGAYLWMIHKAPWMWGLSYYATDTPLTAWFNRGLRRIFNGSCGAGLKRMILEYQPDRIYMTHFCAAEVVAHLKRTKQIQTRAICVVTDFLVHRFWVFPEIDIYAVAHERTKQALMDLKIPERQIVVTGIPVHPNFSQRQARSELAQRYKLDPQVFTALVTSGGSGAGPLESLVRELTDLEMQLLIVCGHNQELLEHLEKLAAQHKGLRVFGFVDNMHELMEVADVIVGKGGGLTLSEALAKEKIFLITSPVPGQETHNAALMQERGTGFWIKSASEMVRVLRRLKDPKERSKIEARICAISKPHAAQTILSLGERA